jgi:hypothetical protein
MQVDSSHEIAGQPVAMHSYSSMCDFLTREMLIKSIFFMLYITSIHSSSNVAGDADGSDASSAIKPADRLSMSSVAQFVSASL